MDLIGLMWQDCPLFISRAQFEESLRDWTLEPVEQDGRVIGCFVVRGAHLHFAKFDATPVGRQHLTRLQQLIDQHGYAETSTPRDDTRQQRFNERLGFERIGGDAIYIHYRILRLRGKKGTTCLQSQSSPA